MRDAPDGDGPIDPVEVTRDERLLREVESGAPPAWFQVGERLARLRDEVRTDESRYTDPATASLPHARYDDPRHNPIAFLPVPPEPQVRDTGDAIDPNAPDPTPGEITDPDHPDYVQPWTGEAT